MRILVHIKKELLLLARDRVGLCVLFVMPMLLVLVLSLIQDSLFRATGETTTKALLVNLDAGALGDQLVEKLTATGALELIERLSGEELSVEKAQQQVFDGEYQFAIIIPSQFSSRLSEGAEKVISGAIKGVDEKVGGTEIALYFDPTVRGVYRSAVSGAIQQGILGLEIEQKSFLLGQRLTQGFRENIDKQLSIYGVEKLPLTLPTVSTNWVNQSLIVLKEESSQPDKYTKLPTSVQQNVPAWTLFGMFFIVIPLAGTLIRERQDGTLTRLLTMPVSSLDLLLGKVVSYLSVCLVQFCLMLLVGRFILPLLGTPVLSMGSAPVALAVVAISSALAACGFGILVGVLAKSYEQASTFGAMAVVIGAAIGGVMVPVYVMPPLMQGLSIISPLSWGLNAFVDIFVRGGNMASTIPYLIALNVFFLVCIACSLIVFVGWRRGL